jgi:hypothetical protein
MKCSGIARKARQRFSQEKNNFGKVFIPFEPFGLTAHKLTSTQIQRIQSGQTGNAIAAGLKDISPQLFKLRAERTAAGIVIRQIFCNYFKQLIDEPVNLDLRVPGISLAKLVQTKLKYVIHWLL